ncbi:MAG: FKBP-type peptidyl-prolyl cis-trans isomerase [Muribaculaceae bacterium]|nr:FKBP-type peptidyl-prolyl cis-trans isomerase [Bacteroidales bacterium]MBR5241204.1 FKBP-type peptidyl-prolyl cis-trans isomerase [Muribaculaceae bacterium]MBR5532650.1 FKBP-type peptidyl-prolyl cis-trans isomerase [Bacteroidales bacterium]
MDKLSYAVGLNIANNLKASGFANLSVDDFAEAVKTVFAGESAKMTEAEARTAIQEFFEKAEKEKLTKNLEEGQKFLTENAKREGVVTLPSGLQYEVITEGTGKKPSATDTVSCHYHGTLIDGTVFDSSVMRNQPAEFPVSGVIKGWVEALQLMSEGAKWKLFIPANLAYGERGAGQSIEPNSTLIFEVELLKVL